MTSGGAPSGGPPLPVALTSRVLAGVVEAARVGDHSASGTDSSGAAVTAERAIEWLGRNKVPLLALADGAPIWLRRDAAFAAAVAAEQEWYETQRREYALVQQAWSAAGIDCLMIKSAGNAPSFPHLSDNIDVLVRPHHGAAARDILRAMGYVELRNIEEPSKYLFRLFRGGRSVSAVHVHEQVIWLVGFMDEDALWCRMRPSEDDPLVNVPSPEDAVLINLAHACYENKVLRFNDVLRVRHAVAARSGQMDWAYMHRVAASRGWGDGLAYLLLVYAELELALFGSTLLPEAQRTYLHRLLDGMPFARRQLKRLRAGRAVELPLDLSYAFCKRLYYRKIFTDPARTRAQRWRDAAFTVMVGVKLKSRLRPQPGLVVSISGADGSGKTAHARALVSALRQSEIRASHLWSRGGSTGLAALPRRFAAAMRRRGVTHSDRPTGGANPQRDEWEDSVERRRRRLANPLVRGVWSWMVAADQIGTYLLRAHLPAMTGAVVVCDRYSFDTAVEMAESLPAEARWSRLAIGALLRFTPRPTLGYVLDVSPATARVRKPEEAWHATLESERRRYGELAARHQLRLLSTEGSFERSSDPLVRDTIMTYMARYETWLNALLWANPSQKNTPDTVWARRRRRPVRWGTTMLETDYLSRPQRPAGI